MRGRRSVSSFDDVARLQRGHIDRGQAIQAGLSDKQIEQLVRDRHWQRPHPGVYLTGSAPPLWEDKVRAACMAAGPDARAMGRTAARLHELDGAEHHRVIELAVPKGHNPVPDGVVVHETRRLDPSLTTTISGVRVSSINQALLEYAWLVRADPPVERAVEDAFRRKPTDEGPLRRFLAQCGRGVNGVTHLRSTLDARPEGRPARSGFEVIVLDILREYGLPMPIRRPLVTVPPDRTFELDLAYLAPKIDIEPMGKKWHSTTTQRRADADRRRVLGAHAWTIIEVWWDEAIYRPADTSNRVRAALLSASDAP